MSGNDTLGHLTAFLHREIPLTRAMGVRVAESNATRIVLEAPLAPNHNHLGTAFGGSLAALATLAGYALLWLALRDRAAHVVIRESSMKFRRPVRGDLRAICRAPDAATLDAFHEAFARTGKARLALAVEIESAGEVAVEFAGTFVAVR
jgi:thioesterase domain-containing protein